MARIYNRPEPTVLCSDNLMLNVPIYDTVNRRYAGFSKVLEHLHDRRPKHLAQTKGFNYSGSYDFHPITWHYLSLVHRMTGSGASFEPDHGYRNTIVFDLAEAGNISDMVKLIRANESSLKPRPIFTSKGNQIPSFNKPTNGYRLGGTQYLCEFAPRLATDYYRWLVDTVEARGGKPVGIRDAVDWTLDWQTRNGMRRFAFVLTAFVMDTAEYFPEWVDPTSHCYYGKNALEAMDLLFVNVGKKSTYYDQLIEHFMADFGGTSFDIEDVTCDYVRYVENFVPKAYRKLEPGMILNSSMIQDHPKKFGYGWNPLENNPRNVV